MKIGYISKYRREHRWKFSCQILLYHQLMEEHNKNKWMNESPLRWSANLNSAFPYFPVWGGKVLSFLEYVITRAPSTSLMVSVLSSLGSVLEMTRTGCVWHMVRSWGLLTEATPAVPLPPESCQVIPIHSHIKWFSVINTQIMCNLVHSDIKIL